MPASRSNQSDAKLDAATAAAAVIEAREAPRVGAEFAIELHGPAFSAPLPARARDISTSGICFATASPIALDSLGSVSLELPTGRTRFNVEGRWQTNRGLDNSVLTGAVFVGLLPAEMASLWDLVDRTGREIGSFLYESLHTQGASLDDAMSLAQVTRVRVVPRGRFLYQRHEPQVPGDDSIFFVRQGGIEMTVPVKPGHEVRVGKVGPGSVLGGLDSVVGMLPLESAQANEETTLLEISKSAFAYLRVAKPLVAHWLGQIVLGEQLRRIDGIVSRLAEKS